MNAFSCTSAHLNTPYTCSRVKRSSGQMSIEFVALFPVMLIIALIAFNGILFLSECAAFDRIFRETASVLAPSPASDESPERVCAQVEEGLDRFTQKAYLSCSVSSSGKSNGLTCYSGTLFFTPTIFGAYPLRSVFGITLQPLEHSIEITLETYKPGVFL